MLRQLILKDGPGTPIVFLHGFLGSPLDWEMVCSHITNRCCIAFELPGHGSTPFVKDFVIPIPYFHLVGYSMGGRIAAMYAKNHPEQVATLTCLSTHPGLLSEEQKFMRRKSDALWVEQLLTLPMDEFLHRWYDQLIFKPFKPDFALRRNHNIQELAAAFLHYGLANQPFLDLQNVLIGARDIKFLSLFKHPIVVENAGHAVHLENPKFIAKIISCLT